MPDTELQTGTVDRAQPAGGMTPATAANSTTLEKVRADAARAKLVVGILTTAATTAASLAVVLPVVAPWNFLGAGALYLGALIVAWRTNTATPEQLQALAEQAGASLSKMTAKKDGAP